MPSALTRAALLGQRNGPSHSQASDLGLYGTTPAAFAAPAAFLPTGLPATSADESAVTLISASQPVVSPTFVQALASQPADLAVAASNALVQPLASAPVALAIQPAAPAAIGQQIVQPTSLPDSGSGSVSPVPPISVVDASTPEAAASDTIAPLVAQVQAQAAQLEQSLAALTQQLQQTGTTAPVPIAEIDQVASGLSAATDALSESGGTVLGNASDAIGQIGTAATATLGDVVDSAGELIGTIDTVVAETTDNVDELIAEVGTAATNIVSTVTTAAGDAVGAATEIAEDLVGSDPVGGIATLVGLVSASDAFALQDDESTMPLLAASDPLGMADLLSSVAPEPLLGIIDHEDGLLGGLDDDLLGLGL